MTSIDFYFNAGDRYAVACRLAAKALQQKKRVLIFAGEYESAQKIDRLLWTQQAVSFIPHCRADEAIAADTPVLIAAAGEPAGAAAASCEVMLNLAADCPPGFERHARLLEIVAQDDADRAAGRARFKFYRDRGYEIRNHDLGKEAGP